MADGKHTPGPWEVQRRQSNGCEICPEIYADRKWVATATGAPYLGFEDTLANARLIAAAPDLLAACKAMIAANKTCDVNDLNSAYRIMEWAIAKAEGAAT